MGSFRSKDSGTTWEHIAVGNPLTNLTRITYDADGGRILGVAGLRDQVYESRDDGNTWKLTAASHWPIRRLSVSGGKLFAVTEFSGVVVQQLEAAATKAAGGGE
jgi:photosystem II stability/assembly factor-like uncharacterized protein